MADSAHQAGSAGGPVPGPKPRESRLLAEAVLLGVVGALAAQAFMWALRVCSHVFLTMLAGYTPAGLPAEGGTLRQHIGPHGLWLIPIATTVGGLISGYLVYTFAPEAEGHGTDTVVKAFHRTGGFIRTRVAPLKLVASAITIGSGGSAGREGPIALVGAGIGSIYATFAHRPDEERRLLVLMGMGAGLSAIFRSPIGTAFFAIEVLYGGMDLEAGALTYTLLASIVAYAVNGLFVGWQPLFSFPSGPSAVPHPMTYLWYGVLGVIAALVGTVLPTLFYRLRDAFRELPIPSTVKPALGGLGVGLMAWKFPQILGGGYGWIQDAIDGKLVIGLLLVLIFAKMLAFALTVSSGGSGGVFAPTLFVGAMLGGFLSSFLHLAAAPFVVIAMAAVFGAAAHVPIASLIMVTEMTGGYRLFVPAAFAVLVAYLLQSQLSSRLKYKSLYEGQVEGRAASPARYAANIRVALDLLKQRGVPRVAKVGHLNLVTLLDSGVSLKLSGGREMSIAALPPHSSLRGQLLDTFIDSITPEKVEVVAILREGRTVLPGPETRLQEEDRLLLFSSRKARERIQEHLAGTRTEAVPPSGGRGNPDPDHSVG
ncbi:MAG TPA: chloride channel protein [Patescibacteria group bacterium]|nr:chloride channel protein [Patescibacteria group bacterium]